MICNRWYWLVGILLLGTVTAARSAQDVTVPALPTPPQVDGALEEWGDQGWSMIAIEPAVEADQDNRTGTITVQIKAGHAGGTFYFAARWPDPKPDTEYRPWEWKRTKYKRSNDRDDMFALRFDLEGDYNKCMVAEANYKVDVWLWSAGRSNLAGKAADMWHLITTSMLDDAAEYKGPSGKTVYIRKNYDDGDPIFANTRHNRDKKQGDRLPGIEMRGGSGSVADVAAKGVWNDGHWSLEISRKLDTGNADDVVLKPGQSVVGQIAVYDEAYAEHKSVSEPLRFEIQ